MIEVKYTTTVKTTDCGYTVMVSKTGTFWGIFKDGKKVTEFMNTANCYAASEVYKFLKSKNAN